MPGLGTFNRTSNNYMPGDKIKASEYVNIPSLVWVRRFETGIKTTRYGERQIVECDVVNLTNGEVKIGVTWFNDALTDQLRPYAENDKESGETREEQPLAIQITWQTPQNQGGNAFLLPEQLTGDWLTYAEQWLAAYPTHVTEERRRREEVFKAQQKQAVPQAPAAPNVPPANLSPVGQAPVAAPAAPQAPVAAPPAAPVAAPPAPAPAAPSAAPPAVPAPAAPQPPVAAPAPAAPVAPPAPPVAPAAPVAAPGSVNDATVDQLLGELPGQTS